jgi:hypothetical protein
VNYRNSLPKNEHVKIKTMGELRQQMRHHEALQEINSPLKLNRERGKIWQKINQILKQKKP